MIDVIVGMPLKHDDNKLKENLEYLEDRRYCILNYDLREYSSDEIEYLVRFLQLYKVSELVYLPDKFSDCIEYKILRWLTNVTKDNGNFNARSVFTDKDLGKCNQLGIKDE